MELTKKEVGWVWQHPLMGTKLLLLMKEQTVMFGPPATRDNVEERDITGDGSANLKVVASSSDGNKIMVGGFPGALWVSTNAGKSWVKSITREDAKWRALSSSADGTRLMAADLEGQLFRGLSPSARKVET